MSPGDLVVLDGGSWLWAVDPRELRESDIVLPAERSPARPCPVVLVVPAPWEDGFALVLLGRRPLWTKSGALSGCGVWAEDGWEWCNS